MTHLQGAGRGMSPFDSWIGDTPEDALNGGVKFCAYIYFSDEYIIKEEKLKIK